MSVSYLPFIPTDIHISFYLHLPILPIHLPFAIDA